MNPRDKKQIKRLKNAASVAIMNHNTAKRLLERFKSTLQSNRHFLTWRGCIIGRVNADGDLVPLMELDRTLGYSRKDALDLAEKHNVEIIFWDKALQKIMDKSATAKNDATDKIKKYMQEDKEFSPHFGAVIDAEDASLIGSTGEPSDEPQEEVKR